MAKNRVYENGTHLSVVATDPATPVSGDPVLVGQLPGVALTNERADGTTTIDTGGVYLLTVKGENNVPANVTVSPGDLIYYDAAATPKLNRDAVNGVRYGYALGTLASGATGVIQVKLGY